MRSALPPAHAHMRPRTIPELTHKLTHKLTHTLLLTLIGVLMNMQRCCRVALAFTQRRSSVQMPNCIRTSPLTFLIVPFLAAWLLPAPAAAVCGADSALVEIAPSLAISICADWQPDDPSPTIIRVVRTPVTSQSTAANVSLTRESLMVQPSWPASVPKFSVDRSRAGFVSIITSQVVVRINLDTLSIDFLYPSTATAPFLTEQAHSFAPDVDAATGDASFLASSVWGPLSQNEALYGGGSFQSGIIDFRNVPVNLVQFNTEVRADPKP